jgi:hypothetical protein
MVKEQDIVFRDKISDDFAIIIDPVGERMRFVSTCAVQQLPARPVSPNSFTYKQGSGHQISAPVLAHIVPFLTAPESTCIAS